MSVWARAIGGISLVCFLAVLCIGQETRDSDSVHSLRSELAELRSVVNELAKKVEALERQNLPRLEDYSGGPPGAIHSGQPPRRSTGGSRQPNPFLREVPPMFK